MVILVRYKNILNGYLVFVPLIIWATLLLIITILGVLRKQTQGLTLTWGTGVFAILLVYLLIKLF